jgi:hypothetical protein
MQLRSLPGQLSFTSVVQALLISATRASLALHASENSAACVFTQSLMRPPPGLTSAHFALMSAAQQGVAEADAVRRCALVKPADTLFQESEGHGDMVPNSRGSLQIIAIFKPS